MLLWRRWSGHKVAQQATRFSALRPLRCLHVALLKGEDGDDKRDAIHPSTSNWGLRFLPALHAYKELNGNTLVPKSFVVPTGDSRWPKVAWGYTLGDGVGYVRRRLQANESHKLSTSLVRELEELEFAQHVLQHRWDKIILPGLRCFHEIYGHSDVPSLFVVPNGNNTWPISTWNLGLGCAVKAIRSSNAYPTQVAASKKELERMHFCFASIVERDWTEKILPSIVTYRQEFGDCLVGRPFIVPSHPPWPKNAKQAARDEEILKSLEFVWDVTDFLWTKRIAPALKVFGDKYGQCKIRSDFVVPSQDPWPEQAWGMKLGRTLINARYSGTFFTQLGRDSKWLDALGLDLTFSAKAFEKRVSPLLETYASIKGSRDIPDNFIIPPKDPWPKKVWGVHLGLIVARNAHHFC
ncbi:hypothetical protein JG688_00014309 [Phytophthora aleatoria]|uniref:Helicase-associated domain-containing protein n=1 Tax=Phytophthora aleatoria TaxID=2496075 RepID=A0A8J5IK79_9STRA|nr:hypothetical protein JG688_00014309 [Phytophthora aleatoria]